MAVNVLRCLCIPVGSIPVVSGCEMLPVLLASKARHGSIVVVVVCTVGMWATRPGYGLALW